MDSVLHKHESFEQKELSKKKKLQATQLHVNRDVLNYD